MFISFDNNILFFRVHLINIKKFFNMNYSMIHIDTYPHIYYIYIYIHALYAWSKMKHVLFYFSVITYIMLQCKTWPLMYIIEMYKAVHLAYGNFMRGACILRYLIMGTGSNHTKWLRTLIYISCSALIYWDSTNKMYCDIRCNYILWNMRILHRCTKFQCNSSIYVSLCNYLYFFLGHVAMRIFIK